MQNAEDAKATEMKIMFDSRDNDPGGSYGKYLKVDKYKIYIHIYLILTHKQIKNIFH